MKKLQTKRKAFTLIELLVVIAIIGILSSIATISFNAARKSARDAKRVSELSQVQTSLEMYSNEYGAYPLNNCSPGASAPVSGCTALSTSGILPGIGNIKDPSYSGSGACANPSTAACEYNIATASSTSYTINFWTEGTKVQGLTQGTQIHKLTEKGFDL